MAKNPDLFLFTPTPPTVLPMESAHDFKRWVLVDGLKPSVALRKLMDKYQCPKMHATIPI